MWAVCFSRDEKISEMVGEIPEADSTYSHVTGDNAAAISYMLGSKRSCLLLYVYTLDCFQPLCLSSWPAASHVSSRSTQLHNRAVSLVSQTATAYRYLVTLMNKPLLCTTSQCIAWTVCTMPDIHMFTAFSSTTIRTPQYCDSSTIDYMLGSNR